MDWISTSEALVLSEYIRFDDEYTENGTSVKILVLSGKVKFDDKKAAVLDAALVSEKE